MPRACWGTIVVVAALLVAGCGSDDEPAGLTARQARDLAARLDEARTLARAGNVAGTEQALDGFRGRVARLRRSGALDDETARALRLGAARALARARADTPPQPEPAPVEPLPAPVAPQAEEDDDEGDDDEKPGKKDKRKGKGKKEKDD